MNISLKKLSASRIEATVILDDARVAALTEKAVVALGRSVKLKGFRPGHVPSAMLREHVPQDRVHEAVIQEEMPAIMKRIIKEHGVKPIIRPRVELRALSPMTLVVMLVEKPEVKVARRNITREIKENKENKEIKERSPEERKLEEEGKMLKLIAEHTKADLAPELIDDEAAAIIEQYARRLSQHGIAFEQWLSSQQKSIEDLLKELRPDAEKRLKIRYGIAELIKELSIDGADPDRVEKLFRVLRQ